MKRTSGLVAAVALVTSFASAQSYHDARYVFGGYPQLTSTLYVAGINLLDATGTSPTFNLLVQPGFYANAARMDVDNRSLVFAVRGTTSTSTIYGPLQSGIFRYDPTTSQITTVYHSPPSTLRYFSPYDLALDQDGNYLCEVYSYDRSGPSYVYELWKIDRTGTVSTFVTTFSLGTRAMLSHKVCRNIQTGKWLVPLGNASIGYAVIELAEDGSFTSWAGGPTQTDYGWYGYYATPQNHRTGALQGPYSQYVYELKPGASCRTTLATLPAPVTGAGRFDLQTAAAPRQVFVSNVTTPRSMALYYLDAATWTVTSHAFAPNRYGLSYVFDFYQGRHTQTVKTGVDRWQIRFSAPLFPGRAYAVAAGVSGVAPGLALPDGRTINLNPDPLFLLTAQNRIPAVFNPGPGLLDSRGEAAGVLDLSGLGRPGLPLWIAWVVLDPLAPSGVAYVPDTYVMAL